MTNGCTDKVYTIPIDPGTIQGMDLRQVKENADESGLVTITRGREMRVRPD
jgi:hypothetical protein